MSFITSLHCHMHLVLKIEWFSPFKKTIYYRRLLLMLTFTSDLRTISLNSSILISSSWSSDVLLPSEAFKDKENTYKAQQHTKRGHS